LERSAKPAVNSVVAQCTAAAPPLLRTQAYHLGASRRRVQGARKGWERNFDDPIPLPKGRALETLADGRGLYPEAQEGRPASHGGRRLKRY